MKIKVKKRKEKEGKSKRRGGEKIMEGVEEVKKRAGEEKD